MAIGYLPDADPRYTREDVVETLSKHFEWAAWKLMNSLTMRAMPFIKELRHWAASTPNHAAVVVASQQLSYASLLGAAGQESGSAEGGVIVIDQPSGTVLAVEFCAAILRGQTVMVLDASWPTEMQRVLKEAAHEWAENNKHLAASTFLLGLSSGTSGTPKAFLRTDTSWRESFAASCEYFGIDQETVTLAPGPLAASMNLYALGESLFAGGTFVGLERFSPEAALAAMDDHKVTRLVVVPTVLSILASRGISLGRNGGQLRQIVCAGSVLSPEILELARTWAPKATIQQYYGAAELGFVAAATLRAGESGTFAGVGRAFPGVQLSICDRNGMAVPAGEAGNVCVKSPFVCSGYAWGDDGLAFSAIGAEGWFTVHDQGSIDSDSRTQDGVLQLAGRASDMILCSGTNVYPHAVEQVLRASSSAALEIIVAGIPDLVRGHKIIAAYRRNGGCESEGLLSGGSEMTSREGGPMDVVAMLRSGVTEMASSHRPSHYYELSELPLTGSGKLSRTILTQWIVQGDPRVTRRS